MEPWETPVLTGYFCKEYPYRTTWSHILLWKDKNNPKELTWDSLTLEFVKKINVLSKRTMSEVLDISSPTARVAPDLLKTLAIQKICSWSRRPETILENRKETAFLEVINKPIIYNFFKDWLQNEDYSRLFFCYRPIPNVLKYRNRDKNFHQSGNQETHIKNFN